MKRLWISLALLLCLLTGALGNIRHVSRISDRLTRRLDRAEACAESGRWAEAHRLTLEAQADWTHCVPYLYTVQCHAVGDEITSGFQQALECIQWQAVPEYSAVNGALTADVEHLAELERLSWKNLL